jgi:hypothetical protein
MNVHYSGCFGPSGWLCPFCYLFILNGSGHQCLPLVESTTVSAKPSDQFNVYPPPSTELIAVLKELVAEITALRGALQRLV